MNKAMQLKDKIKTLALKNHVPAQAVLQSFMLERLLERIASSKYEGSFVFKGGMLVGISNRTTMDMDATLRGYPLSEEMIKEILLDICAIQMDDGVTLALESIIPIREDDEYGGFRAAITARFESINTPLKIDITTGDVITPNPIRYTFRSIFSDLRIEIWAYNLETILAEKVETILRRSVLNTRPRDFYDVYIILKSKSQAVDKAVFLNALSATARKRGSLFVLQGSDRVLQNIRSDALMQQRWDRYCTENYYAQGIGFDEVIKLIAALITPG